MAELTLQWLSDGGDRKGVKIPDRAGVALTADKLGASVAWPLVVATEKGWVITVPQQGSSGEVDGAPLAEVGQKTVWKASDGSAEMPVLRFRLGDGERSVAKLTIPGGRIVLKADGVVAAATENAGAASKPVADAPASTTSPAPPKAAAKPAAPPTPPSGPPTPLPPLPDPLPERKRNVIFYTILIIVLGIDLGAMALLGSRDVPEEVYASAQELPERFAKLIVPEAEPEPEEEAGAGEGEPEPEVEVADQPEDAGEEAGGGDEPQEASAPRSKEEIREKVRTKGILAVFAAKKSAGGALADVLSGDGVAAGLDQALNDVGGVVVAQRGMDITTQRGGGGAKSADIGNLKAGAGRGMGLGDKAKKKVSAGVKTASFTSQGSLSADAIRAVVEKNLRGIKFCYEKQLANNPDLKGKVVVQFTIGTDGKVKKYKIEKSSLNNPDVERCILSRVRRWTFPKPEKDAVTVSYPFIFTATG
ncbi:MAG: TonB family protein [Candidatus Dadabacteria bacterium]|nr:MAG: TonB family protein [Candidatus Dadabacteria bacterium]